MNSKNFLKTFGMALVIVFGLIGVLNYVVSPFGLFQDRFIDWYSFNMTQNPRIAKVEYLKKTGEDYDSFIVGASGASSFPTDYIKKVTGDDYYNVFSYGADMLDSVNTVKWLVDHYQVKNLLLPIGYTSAAFYDVGNDTFNNAMHEELDDTNKFRFYSKYLLANPRYSIDKLRYRDEGKFLAESYNVFDVSDGSYDKRKRDIEPINSLDDYLEREDYSQFLNYQGKATRLDHLDEFIASIEEIKSICQAEDINLKILVIPMYHEDFQYFNKSELEEFYSRLAEVANYYDFGKTSISYDPRYFYDRTHFRNDVGRMILASIYGDQDVFLPEDFGIHVKDGDPGQVLDRLNSDPSLDPQLESKLTALMYHNFASEGDGGMTISHENFKNQMQAIKDAGYETVTPEDIYDYVNFGKAIPEKSVVITIDDGYRSNLEEVYEILKDFGFQATIFPIGHSIGKDTYKDTGHKIHPHFDVEEAMEKMDVFTYGSHTYDMHQSTDLEKGKLIRNFAIPLEGEDEFDFAEAFRKDIEAEDEALKYLMPGLKSFAYPGGVYSEISAVLLEENGYKVSFLTVPHQNYLVKGLRQTALGLGRFNMTDHTTYEDTLKILNTYE